MEPSQKTILERLASLLETPVGSSILLDSGDVVESPDFQLADCITTLRTRASMLMQHPTLSIIGDRRTGKSCLIRSLISSDEQNFHGAIPIEIPLENAPAQIVNEASTIIFILNATRILSMKERTVIETLLGSQDLDHAFFVVNFINQLDTSDLDELREYVSEALKESYPDADSRRQHIFYVNAKAGDIARQQGDAAGLLAAGISSLEETLAEHLSRGVHQDAARMAAETALYVSGLVFDRLNQLSLDIRIPEKPAELEKIEKEMDDLARLHKDVGGKLERFQALAREQVGAGIADLNTTLPRILFAAGGRQATGVTDVVNYAFNPSSRASIESNIREQLQSELNELIQERLRRISRSVEDDTEILPTIPGDSPNFIIPDFRRLLEVQGLSAAQSEKIGRHLQQELTIGREKERTVRWIVRVAALFLVLRLPGVILKASTGVGWLAYEINLITGLQGRLAGMLMDEQEAIIKDAVREELKEFESAIEGAVNSYISQYQRAWNVHLENRMLPFKSIADTLKKEYGRKQAETLQQESKLEQIKSFIFNQFQDIYQLAYPQSVNYSPEKVIEIAKNRAELLRNKTQD